MEYSRRFHRELDEAPGGNNLQYIYYSVLTVMPYKCLGRICTLITRITGLREEFGPPEIFL